jgi:HD-like signal output (HDOD) protein
MRKILFVDDEPKVLDGLRRMLRPMRHEWEMDFAEGGQAALEILSECPFDVVVSDMRMPGMDGAQLLSEVRNRSPQTVRIILSGHSDHEMIMKSVGPAHQYLSKPCDPETLKGTVGRACALRDLLTNDALQLLVADIQSLPTLPSLYTKLVQELESPDASIKAIGEIISQDVGMTAKILQMVNSSFFGLRRHVSNAADAASLLGVDTIRALVLSIQVFSQFHRIRTRSFTLESLWSHCTEIGILAKSIAKAEGQNQQLADEAFTAGLLHETGRLVLAASLPEKYQKAEELMRAEHILLADAEREVFGASHTEIGAYLLGLWGLPNSIVEAVAFHLNPSQCPAQQFSPLTAVHVAHQLKSRRTTTNMEEELTPPLDLEYLKILNLTDRLTSWQEIQDQMA